MKVVKKIIMKNKTCKNPIVFYLSFLRIQGDADYINMSSPQGFIV